MIVVKIYLHSKQRKKHWSKPSSVWFWGTRVLTFLEECIQKQTRGYIYSGIIDVEAFIDSLYRDCTYEQNPF